MINFNKNKLINSVLANYYDTFARTLDTSDFVPERYNKKISKYIFKNMKKAFRRIDKEDRKYQRLFRKKVRKQEKEQQRLAKPKKQVLLSKLFKKKPKKEEN